LVIGNLRASYICRNPYDNLTNRAPYFHGIYTRDNPSDELSWDNLNPVLRNGFQTGFPFGKANFGVDTVVAFEVPTREVGIPFFGLPSAPPVIRVCLAPELYDWNIGC
jgi:hypothetical protein